MRQLPPSRASAGYTPNRLNPLALAPVADQGERLTDLMAIQRLFVNGEQGGYWPADPAYLYEDSAGTIPASVNGVVGLRLDVGRGLSRGQNLVANGNFHSTITGWTFHQGGDGGTISHEAGRLKFVTNLYGSCGASQDVSVTPGVLYEISGDIENPLAEINLFQGGGFTGYYGYFTNSKGEIRVIPVTNSLRVYCYSPSNQASSYFDNVSVVSFSSNAAIQATTANKPYLRRTPVSNKYWLDSNTSTGALTATFASSLGSACTIATVGAEGVTIAENQTIGTTYNITPYDASQLVRYRGDILIINRVLTPAEKALITRHFKRGVPMISNGAIL